MRRHAVAASVFFLCVCLTGTIQALEITTTSLPAGMEMAAYVALLEATNGIPPYTWSVTKVVENSQANSFSVLGTAQGWHADDQSWVYDLPFEFPFFGNMRTRLWVSSNGTITFDGHFTQWWADENTFKTREMIAPLWNDYVTDAPYDIFVAEHADSVSIRWRARYWGDPSEVNFAAELHRNGQIVLKYGGGNANGGMIGVSAGDGQNYLLSVFSQSGSMDNADDILFIPAGLPEGLVCLPEGLVTGTPTLAGTNVVIFVVQDSVGASTNKSLEIVIAPNPNTRPVITSNAPPAGAFSMGEATSQLFRVWAYDPEGQGLTYAWTWDGLPVGGDASAYTHTTAWGDAGRHVLRCYVSDDLWQNIVYCQWIVTVLDDNDGDGMPNWQELDLGRDPNDPNDGGNQSSLFGTVRGGGHGLAGAYVELRGQSDTVYHQTLTDDTGAYTLDGVWPGHYFVKVGADRFADEWYDNATHRTSAVPYTVPADAIIGGVDFDLEYGQSPALVEVTSDPAGAAIYLDYQPTAEVTPAVLNVGEIGDRDWSGYALASHVITVKKAGRPRPAPQAVTAREAETVGVHFDLTSDATGSVAIVTVPDGATVFVDYADSADGVTPVVVGHLAPGSHVILLQKPGYLQPRPVVVWVQEMVPMQESGRANSFSEEGSLWQSGMDEVYELALPFAFPFFGTAYTNCFVDIHGNITFAPFETDFSPSEEELADRPMIAAMWNDFLEYGDEVDIFVASMVDAVTIRWQLGSDLNVSATLDSLGRIELRYGAGNANGGMIGVSAGDGANYVLSVMSQSGNMDWADDIVFEPASAHCTVTVPLTEPTASDRVLAEVRSVPPGATLYVDYLPTTNVTDVVVDWLDPASHAGSGWHSASHTIMLRKDGFLPTAPRRLLDWENETQPLVIHLLVDAVTAVDTDHDGMPDQWEQAYRLPELAPGQDGAEDDPDGDGLSNIDEMRAGTNPLDGHSLLAVADLTVAGSGPGRSLTFVFDTVPGRLYLVQGADDLHGPWQSISGLITATDYRTAVTIELADGVPHGYYRAVVLAP